MPERRTVLLEAREIGKIYGKVIKTIALKGLNLQIKPNEFITLIGPSGCGKTTLANILGALDQPTSGEIYFQGQSLGRMKQNQLAEFRNRHIGFVFQFHFLLKEFTALENVLMPTWIQYQVAPAKKVKRARELLELVGLKERMNNKGNHLSGGQQQRVAIARSLINEPSIILADEPTGNLDSTNTDQIFGLLRKINQEIGTTFLIITHERHIAAKSSRVVEMLDGEIIKDYHIEDNRQNEDKQWLDLAPEYCKLCQADPSKHSNLR
jgi:lipoprotein-releasing system ATP-binding protein